MMVVVAPVSHVSEHFNPLEVAFRHTHIPLDSGDLRVSDDSYECILGAQSAEFERVNLRSRHVFGLLQRDTVFWRERSWKPEDYSLPEVRIHPLDAVGGLSFKLIFWRALSRQASRRCGFVVSISRINPYFRNLNQNLHQTRKSDEIQQ